MRSLHGGEVQRQRDRKGQRERERDRPARSKVGLDYHGAPTHLVHRHPSLARTPNRLHESGGVGLTLHSAQPVTIGVDLEFRLRGTLQPLRPDNKHVVHLPCVVPQHRVLLCLLSARRGRPLATAPAWPCCSRRRGASPAHPRTGRDARGFACEVHPPGCRATCAAVLDEARVAPDPLAVQSRAHRLTQSQCGARRCTCTRV